MQSNGLNSRCLFSVGSEPFLVAASVPVTDPSTVLNLLPLPVGSSTCLSCNWRAKKDSMMSLGLILACKI